MFARAAVLVIGTALGLLGAGCGPAMTEVSQVATVSPRPAVFKMVVLGANMDPAERIAIEDGLVADLRKRGIDARPSYAFFEGHPAGGDEARDAFVAQGYEAVLRIKLKRIDRTIMSDDVGDYVWTKIDIHTTLWDTASDSLVWSAETLTRDPVDESDLARSVSVALLPELTNARLILPVRATGT